MSTKAALTAQYLGTLAMLRQSVERCPAELWEKTAGMRPRQFWRIAYHATYYTDLYLAQTEADFTDPPHYQEEATNLWAEPKDGVQPRTLTPDEVLAYIDDVMAGLPARVEALDLEAPESGYHWYPGFTKLEHQFLNLRHLGIHVGQLQELLMGAGVDVNWLSRAK